MSSTKVKSKQASKPAAEAASSAVGADRPETITEEQENESSSIHETTSISRMSRQHNRTGMRDKTTTNISQMRLENTYKLKPDIPFRVGKVNEKINQILASKLSDFVYSPDKASHVTMELSSGIKAAVKSLKMTRHKLVVLVTMFPTSDDCRPSVVYSSRCLWNTETDNSTSVTYSTRTATVLVLVFGLYFD